MNTLRPELRRHLRRELRRHPLRGWWRLGWMQVSNEPPWRPPLHYTRLGARKGMWHWSNWLTGWVWALAGLVLGAFVAPPLVQLVGLSTTGYQATMDIGVSVLAGFLVRLLGWFVYVFVAQPVVAVMHAWTGLVARPVVTRYGALIIAAALPLAGVGYGLSRYLHWVGAGQARVTVAFVGGFLVKAFLVPLVTAIVTGAALKWLITRFRGKNAPKPGL